MVDDSDDETPKSSKKPEDNIFGIPMANAGVILGATGLVLTIGALVFPLLKPNLDQLAAQQNAQRMALQQQQQAYQQQQMAAQQQAAAAQQNGQPQAQSTEELNLGAQEQQPVQRRSSNKIKEVEEDPTAIRGNFPISV